MELGFASQTAYTVLCLVHAGIELFFISQIFLSEPKGRRGVGGGWKELGSVNTLIIAGPVARFSSALDAEIFIKICRVPIF